MSPLWVMQTKQRLASSWPGLLGPGSPEQPGADSFLCSLVQMYLPTESISAIMCFCGAV